MFIPSDQVENDRARPPVVVEAHHPPDRTLRRWIDDQVRNGIAGISVDPYAGWSEPIAKRMVDAKAPGLARWLRSLPGHLTDDEWPRKIIEDLGLMRLLTDAYRTIDALPEETAAAVRRHIGFTVARAEVRSEEHTSELQSH